MPRLHIELTKHPDGGYVIACTRVDGSVTWQRGGDAAFFPGHDLTHYAVETELRHRRGFFGLLAEGWAFTDFSSDWPRRAHLGGRGAGGTHRRAPRQRTAWRQHRDVDRPARPQRRAAHDRGGVQRRRRTVLRADWLHGRPTRSRVNLTDDELSRIRRRRDELLAEWQRVPPGGRMELTFDV